MQDRISFKREPRNTGLSAIGSPHPNTRIKLNGKRIGNIQAPTWQTEDNKWSAGIMVNKDCPDDNPNCSWKWVFFKNRFDSEEEAKMWFMKIFDQIKQKYNIHSSEEDY